MSKYSTDLMVREDGFNLYFDNFEDELKSLSEISSFFLKWAQIEAQYAKELQQLSKNVNKKAWKKVEKELGTTQVAWGVIHDQIDIISKKHEDISSKFARE